jgi:hypothetical protein
MPIELPCIPSLLLHTKNVTLPTILYTMFTSQDVIRALFQVC